MSYYLERGHDLDKLCNLSPAQKLFYTSSAQYWLEYEQTKFKTLLQALGVKFK